MLIENLRQNIAADGISLRERLEESRRLIKIPIESLTNDDFELMDILQGQLQRASKRMQSYDKRWYELHRDLKGLDDCYKIVYHSKQAFQSNSPMYLAALSGDAFECLRARMSRFKQIRRKEKDEPSKKSDHTVSVQYSNGTNENHRVNSL
jgi:hypothetical protein